jgi:Astacin (Peptidase family M12A)
MTTYFPSAMTVLLASFLITWPSPHARAQTDTLEFARIVPELSDYGAVDLAARWDRNIISVCWLNRPEYVTERRWVRESIAQTWEAVSSVQFVGWADCTADGADVRIRVDESGPRSYVGRAVVGKSPSTWLNFTFKRWSPDCQQKREPCIKSIAAHEFGHILGFDHEQLRKDAPQACIDHLKQSDDWEVTDRVPTPLTPYDPNSIMNYCNAIYNNNGRLSPNDITAAKILFP